MDLAYHYTLFYQLLSTNKYSLTISIKHQPYGYLLVLDEPPAAVNVVIHHKSTTSAIVQQNIACIDKKLHSCAVAFTPNGKPVVPIFPLQMLQTNMLKTYLLSLKSTPYQARMACTKFQRLTSIIPLYLPIHAWLCNDGS